MRIAFHLPSLAGGGAERCAVDLCNVLPEAVVVVERLEGPFVDRVSPDQVRVADCPPGSTRLQRALAVAREARGTGADVIVSLLNPLVGLMAAERSRVPFVYWLQNPASETQRPIRRWPKPLQREVMRALTRRAAIFLTSSPGLAHGWDAVGAPIQRHVTLPNAVDLRGLEPPPVRPRVPPDRTLRLLTVGRLAPQKRQDLILKALEELPAKHDWTLDIIGEGPLREGLTHLVRESPVGPRISMRGFVDDVATWFNAADVFVLASNFEGFGNVLVQALGAGLRIVSTDAPTGPRFILDGERHGALVPPGDVSALAAAVSRSLSLSRQTEYATGPGVARARRFAPESVRDDLREILGAVLAGESPPRRW